MIEVSFQNIPPAFTVLFDANNPGQLRFDTIMTGEMPGRFFADDAQNPTWAVLLELLYGTIYIGGKPDKDALTSLINSLLQDNDEILYGFWPNDKRFRDLLPIAGYEGTVLDFTDRSPQQALDAYLKVPEGCEIQPFTLDLFQQSEDYESSVASFGSAEKALEKGMGFCLLRDGEIVAESFAGAPVNGVVEVGMTTREAHRRKGYATVVIAHLIQACEARGYRTYWNCNQANTPSVIIAHKMGYQTERPYTLLAWFKPPS